LCDKFLNKTKHTENIATFGLLDSSQLEKIKILRTIRETTTGNFKRLLGGIFFKTSIRFNKNANILIPNTNELPKSMSKIRKNLNEKISDGYHTKNKVSSTNN